MARGAVVTVNLTLSETETCLRKAARACGLDWGLAEEAGKAARWLAAFGLPGPELVFAHLQKLRHQDYRCWIPDCSREPWRAAGGLICPIIAGAALSDRSARLLLGQRFDLGPTASPLLLAAIVNLAARHHRAVFALEWTSARVLCHENGLTIDGEREDLLRETAAAVRCYRGREQPPRQLPSTRAYLIDESVFHEIDQLAFETYVPATETSRAGAGAGLTDND